MSKFKIGEIAIIVNPDKGTVTGFDSSGFNGQECEIIGFDEPLNIFEYVIDVLGNTYYVMESELKKKPDNEEKLSTWEEVAKECFFIPNRELVENE